MTALIIIAGVYFYFGVVCALISGQGRYLFIWPKLLYEGFTW